MMFKLKRILCGLLVLYLHSSAWAIAEDPHYGERLIKGWQYHQGDVGGIWEMFRQVTPGSPEAALLWESVVLPHCFNAFDAVDPEKNYYQGPGWYRNAITVNNPFQQGRTLLHFEGAGQKTTVYVYLTKVGEHTGGYDEWSVDITEAIQTFMKSDVAKRFGNKIPIAIRCDNSRDLEMIPSNMSDFTVYGGLYRYLNLVYEPAFAVQDLQIQASVDAKGKEGIVLLKTLFANYTHQQEATVNYQVLDPQGRTVVQKNVALKDLSGNVSPGELKIKSPSLWSTTTPQLYTLNMTVTSAGGTQHIVKKFGFRHFEFVKNGPFMLNGKRLLIRGTHRHEDHAGVGAAMTEEEIRREMKMIKEMGANFIRLGHYQQSRIVLDLCDSLGLLVWEEIPWCRGGLGGEEYKGMARRMLTNMITQHSHHPAVIIWGLGNENDWPGDFESFDKEAIRNFMRELNTLAHTLDATRKTGIRRCDFCKDIVDVYSPSIWAGWYRGKFTEYKELSKKEMEGTDHFIHMEWGGDSHYGRHAEDPDKGLEDVQAGNGGDERRGDATMTGGIPRTSRDGDWSETYMCNLIDWHLKEQETMPWLTGSAFWTFKDFATPIRPENPVPYVNQKGVVARDLGKKETFYVFQSYWSSVPMIHIYGSSWPVRWGEAEEEKLIKVYSNCDEVELFVNGKSAGKKKHNSQDYPATGFHWSVTLKGGSNTIKAVGTKGKATLVDNIEFFYQTAKWNAPHTLVIDKIEYQQDTAMVYVKAVDDKKVTCLDAKNQITYSLAGTGKLIDNLGTSTGSRKVELANGHGMIRVKLNKAENTIGVTADGLQPAYAKIGTTIPSP